VKITVNDLWASFPAGAAWRHRVMLRGHFNPASPDPEFRH
jgi:hypothetical protein